MGGAAITVASICDAIDSVVGDALITAEVVRDSQSYNQLKEGMNDEMVLQIYPESGDIVDSRSGLGQTQKLTLGETEPVIIQESITCHVDYYARQRSHLGEDMAAVVAGIDAIRTELKKANCQVFGLDDAHTFQWSWRRVIFDYGAPELKYPGVRFILTFRIF